MGDEHLVMYHSGNFHVANMANLWLIYDIYIIIYYIYMQRRWFFIAVLNNHRVVILVMLCGGGSKNGDTPIAGGFIMENPIKMDPPCG